MAYGGCVQIRSIESSAIGERLRASPFTISIIGLNSHSKFTLFFVISSAFGLISTPIKFLFVNFA